MARDAFGDELPLVPDRSQDRGTSPLPGVPSTPALAEWSSSSAAPTSWTGSGGPSVRSGSSAPVGLLVVAGALVGLSLLLAALAARRPALAVTGWLLGGFAALGVLGWYTVVDARRRTDPWYEHRSWPDGLRLGLLLAAGVAVMVNSLRFADWASRL